MNLLVSDCSYEHDCLVFTFAENGGQTEGDNQGWWKSYTFTFNEDLECTDIEYNQG